MSGKNVFIVGPGFIGWVVLDLLQKEGYKITTLVRRKEHGQAIQAQGATVVYGDLNDHDKIVEHTIANDITIHTATADHLPSAQAVLDGLKKRVAEGKSALYIHTSGTSILDDAADGQHGPEKIYHDNDPASIHAIPASNPHREIDITIANAAKEFGSKAKIAIMTPPEIYGFNAWNGRLTIQLPTLTRFAIKHGFSGYVGKGLSKESSIHVNDLARGYIVLLHYMEKESSTKDINSNPFWFCESGHDFSWKDAATEIGKGLHKAGKLQDPTPKTIPETMYKDLFGDFTSAVIGLNSISRADRLRELGWKPTEKSIFESFHEDELPVILKEVDHDKFAGYTGTVAS